MRAVLRYLWRLFRHAAPNIYFLNYAVAARHFNYENGRFPRRPNAKNATINDFIFDKMIRNRWSNLHKACVDKEYAKLFVLRSSCDVKVARTLAVYHVDSKVTTATLERLLRPFLGKRLIAKPTHSSGAMLFLDKALKAQDISHFLSLTNVNYFKAARETQYDKLERKILIEENVSINDEVNIVRLYCSYGVVHCVELSIGQVVAIISAPDCRVLSAYLGSTEYTSMMPNRITPPGCLDRMIAIAQQLSAKFDFVRVDLYDAEEGIFFSELTFSPGAGGDLDPSDQFGIEFLDKVRSVLKQYRPEAISPAGRGSRWRVFLTGVLF